LSKQKIMVVDDDVTINSMVKGALEAEGYKVVQAYSGTEALLVIGHDSPDLILLDLMLPGLTGEEILPKLSGIPTIVVSAKADTEEKVRLLYAGACDYVTKPFVISELIARIAVALRTAPQGAGNGTASAYGPDPGRRGGIPAGTGIGAAYDDPGIMACGVTLRTDLNTVSVSGEDIPLTRTEAAILNILMLNAERPLGKSTILDRIMDSTPDCTERSLKQHISNIRKKIEAVDGVDHIEAVYGIGFRFH